MFIRFDMIHERDRHTEHSAAQVAVCAERHCTTDHWHMRRCDHITKVLRELHWIPTRKRVKFKLACLVHQSLFGQSPAYLADDCRLVSDSTCRSLRSADVPTCVVPAAAMATEPLQLLHGPRLWNSLPVQLCNPCISYGRFRRQLRGSSLRER